MNLESAFHRILRLIILLHILTAPVHSSSQYGRRGRGPLSRREIASIRNEARRAYHHHHKRWSGRQKPIAHFFTPWSAWSHCDTSCKKHRERYCRVKRKCGHTQHVEMQKCWGCQQHHHHHHYEKDHHNDEDYLKSTKYSEQNPKANVENHIHPVVFKESYSESRHFRRPFETYEKPKKHHHYIEEDEDDSEEGDEDFYIIKKRKTKSHKRKKKRRPVLINEYEDDEEDFNDHRYLPRKYKTKNSFRSSNRDFDTENNEPDDYGGSEEMEVYLPSIQRNDYDGGYHSETGNLTRAVVQVPPKQRRLYTKWSKWSKCTPKCTTRRFKKCRAKEICGKEVLREIAYCYTEGSFCQQWLQAQIERSQTYDIRPSNTRRNDFMESENSLHHQQTSLTTTSNSNSNTNDFNTNGKGYRGQEYEPLKLKCGIAPALRNNRRNMNNLLKIIGGKASRKGEWPWQVAIFNRYKEAFCGGTLIAPQWVLTAAHCLRKVLYVRLGEHNLDFEEGSEMQFRVLRSYKHPNFDRRTVDSDIALLKLPRPVNTTTYIGFSCLPRPYQSLPKNVECTVIGWGKRRNTDQSGTSILHQAEVPLIPMDNCRSVYHDYTITKNMFCAGHRRGRIDTCAGDSGGPLLCRDSTKPNHPWTIFGITSFGDGCAKRNKFGIYAKVPNYVDWIWSVINCNGNCKPPSLNRKL